MLFAFELSQHPSPTNVSIFVNDPATTEIYTLSLHDALPIFRDRHERRGHRRRVQLARPLHRGGTARRGRGRRARSEEHTSELQSLRHLVCRLLLEKKKRCTSTMR